jgi:hypothetical protein
VSGALTFGAVLHWKQFPFPDGGQPKDKFLLVLGAKQGHDFLLVLANTNRKHKYLTPGCHAKLGFYLIPGGGKDFFPDDTLVVLKPLTARSAELVKGGLDKTIHVAANLSVNLAGHIRNCLKQSDDVSDADLALL